MTNEKDPLMIPSHDGEYAICLDKENRAYNWLFYKGPGGRWVTLRPALPLEIMSAMKKLEDSNTEPQRG